jgi:hypothetical protein
VAETIRPAKQKIFTPWPISEKSLLPPGLDKAIFTTEAQHEMCRHIKITAPTWNVNLTSHVT